jgi:hypothetical protein
MSVTQQQPRHAFVTECHDAAYTSSSRHLPPEHHAIRSNLFFLDGPGFSERCVLLSLFHIKAKKGEGNSGGREITTGGHLREYAALKPTNMVEEPERGGVVFHPFLRRNFALSHPLCTPCGHCRSSVTRSRDPAVTVLQAVFNGFF